MVSEAKAAPRMHLYERQQDMDSQSLSHTAMQVALAEGEGLLLGTVQATVTTEVVRRINWF